MSAITFSYGRSVSIAITQTQQSIATVPWLVGLCFRILIVLYLSVDNDGLWGDEDKVLLVFIAEKMAGQGRPYGKGFSVR